MSDNATLRYIHLRFKSNRGEALETFQNTSAEARSTAPIKLSVVQATVYMQDSEGRVSLAARQWQFA
jgi:hypothetical protein